MSLRGLRVVAERVRVCVVILRGRGSLLSVDVAGSRREFIAVERKDGA